MSASGRLRTVAQQAGSPLGSSAIASLTIFAINATTGLLLAHTLGPRGRGQLAAVLLWPNLLVTLGALGMLDAATYQLARAPRRLATLAATTARIAFVQAIALGALGAAIVPFALAHHGASAVHSGELFLLYVPLFFLMNYPLNLLQGLQRFRAANVARVLAFAPVALGFSVLALMGRLTVANAVYVYLGTYLLAGIITVAMLFGGRLGPVSDTAPRYDSDLARSLLGFGVRSHLSNVTGVLTQWVDQIAISLFLVSAQLGLYVVAGAVTSLTTMVSWTISLVLLPRMAGLGQGREQLAAAARYLRLTLLGACLVVAPLLAVMPQVLRLLFGQGFVAAALPARVLLVASVPVALSQVLGALLKGLGRPLDAGLSQAVALLTTIVSLAVLLPALGLVGAACASLVGACVGVALLAIRAIRAVGPGVFGFMATSSVATAVER